MWPSTPSAFGKLPCPEGEGCILPNCIFGHDAAKPGPSIARTTPSQVLEPGREAKRRRLDEDANDPILQTSRLTSERRLQASNEPRALKPPTPALSTRVDGVKRTSNNGASKADALRSMTRTVSPPSRSTLVKTAPAAKGPEVDVPLHPRKVQKEPVIFTKRIQLLKMLRDAMASLNDKVAKSVDSEIKALHLGGNQLNKLAVEEEGKVASEKARVYENELKMRIVRLRKATLDDWVKERRDALPKDQAETPSEKPPEPVVTGLTPKEEVIMLSRLISPQAGLDNFGYVTRLPTSEEVMETERAVYMSQHWEQCDRCNTRFQVFPDRREEDGKHCTGGKCTFHWGKRVFPKKSKNDFNKTRWGCCNEEVGTSPGCTTGDTHVFKISESKRLSTVVPFLETPENPNAKPHTAVCFDCEMGYTVYGLELMRLTAVSWPSHEPLIDVLVRPRGFILDFNTRFSGIHHEQFINAAPYNPKNPSKDPKNLQIVDSIPAARALLFSHISRDTPLLGHALENDLNSVRIIHPTIVDTVLLYPHFKGLPIRQSLRGLAKTHLGWSIQTGGAAGHDSFEDAKATGELVRLKVKNEWIILKDEGWTLRDDGVFPPLPPDGSMDQVPPLAQSAPQMVVPSMVLQPEDDHLTGKRKRGPSDDEENEGSEK